MSNYSAPGVYAVDITTGSATTTTEASSVGALIGTMRSGPVGKMTLVTSFTEFISKFANGLDTPFTETSDLPYAVHGFFANGGKNLYVGRVVSSTAKKATLQSTTNKITATALYEGTWGNDISISIKKNKGYKDSTNLVFDVTISVGTSDSVTINEVTLATMSDMVLSNTKASKWLGQFEIAEETATLAEETFTLTSGADGVADLEDSDFVNALSMLDEVDSEVFLVAVAGQTSNTINNALIKYADENLMFPILDMPMDSSVDDVIAYRKTINAFGGALAYPWGYITDPLTNSPRKVPTCGHVMGVYSRTIQEYGVHQSPAGSNAVVQGFISLETKLGKNDIGELNKVGVVSICTRPNSGIVLWGARGLNNDKDMKYVSDIILNYSIKRHLKADTEFAVFKPNTPSGTLWSEVEAVCNAYLENLREQGALVGDSRSAYYVTVDDSNNTDETIANGELNIEIGYAPVKPAEFIIIKLSHSIIG